MSFEVKIGVCKDAKNKVSKSPSWNYTLSGQLKDSCDILNPTIKLIIGDSKDIKLPHMSTHTSTKLILDVRINTTTKN